MLQKYLAAKLTSSASFLRGASTLLFLKSAFPDFRKCMDPR